MLHILPPESAAAHVARLGRDRLDKMAPHRAHLLALRRAERRYWWRALVAGWARLLRQGQMIERRGSSTVTGAGQSAAPEGCGVRPAA